MSRIGDNLSSGLKHPAWSEKSVRRIRGGELDDRDMQHTMVSELAAVDSKK